MLQRMDSSPGRERVKLPPALFYCFMDECLESVFSLLVHRLSEWPRQVNLLEMFH